MSSKPGPDPDSGQSLGLGFLILFFGFRAQGLGFRFQDLGLRGELRAGFWLATLAWLGRRVESEVCAGLRFLVRLGSGAAPSEEGYVEL